MNRTLTLLGGAALLLAGCAAPFVRESTGKGATIERGIALEPVRLGNSELELEFLPGSMGRISSFEIRRSGMNLCPNKYELKEIIDTPLFVERRDNQAGKRDLLWGKIDTGVALPMNVTHQDEHSICFASDFYGNTLFGMERRVRLIPDSAIVEIEVTLTNNGRKPDAPALWLNEVAKTPDTISIPARGGANQVRGRGKLTYGDRDFIFTGRNGESYLAPARPWLGMTCNAKDGKGYSYAVTFDPKYVMENGYYYCWCNMKLFSFEPLFSTKKLAPGGKLHVVYRYQIFDRLSGLNAVIGTRGIALRQGRKNWKLEIVSSAPVPAAKFELAAVKADGSRRTLATRTLKAAAPGEPETVKFTAPAKDEELEITVDGVKERLLQPIPAAKQPKKKTKK